MTGDSELYSYRCREGGTDTDYTTKTFCNIEAKALLKSYRQYIVSRSLLKSTVGRPLSPLRARLMYVIDCA